MAKRLTALLAALVLALGLAPALAETRGVIAPMETYDARVKLRERPGGTVIGQYYAGTGFTVLDRSGDWTKISLGDVDGWMMTRYLNLSPDGTETPPLGDIAFPEPDGCIRLQVRRTHKLLRIPADTPLWVLGTSGEAELHVRADLAEGPVYGFCSSEQVAWGENLGWAAVKASPEQAIHVRNDTSTSAASLARLYPGTRVRLLFDHHNAGDGWRRIRNGSVGGYMKEEFLDFSSGPERAYVPRWGRLKEASVIVSGAPEGIGEWSDADPFFILGTTGSSRMPLYYCEGSTWLADGTYGTVNFYIRQDMVTPAGAGSIPTRANPARSGIRGYWQTPEGGLAPAEDVAPLERVNGLWILGGLEADGNDTGWGPYLTADTVWVVCQVELGPSSSLTGLVLPLADVAFDERLVLPQDWTGG